MITTNANHKSETSKQCMEFHRQLIPQFINTTTENISRRITEMILIINRNMWISSQPVEFTIHIPQMVNQAMQQITPIIKANTLVDISACKKVPKSQEDYRKVARNRLNRNKPKFVGNFVFGPLIFDRLYTFCGTVFGDNQLNAFISILGDILAPESVIRFKQTRAQPLIPYNTFVCDNAFRNSCTMLLRHYGLEQEWKNKTKLKAEGKWRCFYTKCLPKLAEKCHRNDYRAPRCLYITQRDTYSTKTPITADMHDDVPSINNLLPNLVTDAFVDMDSNPQPEHKGDDEYVTEYGFAHGNPMPIMIEPQIQPQNWQISAPNSSKFSPRSSLDTSPINNYAPQFPAIPPIVNQSVFDVPPQNAYGDNNDPNVCASRVNCNPFCNLSSVTFQRNMQMNSTSLNHNGIMNNNRFCDAVHCQNGNSYCANNCCYRELGQTNTFVDDWSVNKDDMGFDPWNKEEDIDEMESLGAFALDSSFLNNESPAVFDESFDIAMTMD